MTPRFADADRYVTWTERAAIAEYDGGLDRAAAEAQASRECGGKPAARGIGICQTLDEVDAG
jgi:hypothetical protein